MARVTAHDRLVLALRDRVGSQEKWPRDLDGMLGLLGVKPLPLGIAKQLQELIDLLFGRAHLERAGLDADELQANGRDDGAPGFLGPRKVRHGFHGDRELWCGCDSLSTIRRGRKRPDI